MKPFVLVLIALLSHASLANAGNDNAFTSPSCNRSSIHNFRSLKLVGDCSAYREKLKAEVRTTLENKVLSQFKYGPGDKCVLEGDKKATGALARQCGSDFTEKDGVFILDGKTSSQVLIMGLESAYFKDVIQARLDEEIDKMEFDTSHPIFAIADSIFKRVEARATESKEELSKLSNDTIIGESVSLYCNADQLGNDKNKMTVRQACDSATKTGGELSLKQKAMVCNYAALEDFNKAQIANAVVVMASSAWDYARHKNMHIGGKHMRESAIDVFDHAASEGEKEAKSHTPPDVDAGIDKAYEVAHADTPSHAARAANRTKNEVSQMVNSIFHCGGGGSVTQNSPSSPNSKGSLALFGLFLFPFASRFTNRRKINQSQAKSAITLTLILFAIAFQGCSGGGGGNDVKIPQMKNSNTGPGPLNLGRGAVDNALLADAGTASVLDSMRNSQSEVARQDPKGGLEKSSATAGGPGVIPGLEDKKISNLLGNQAGSAGGGSGGGSDSFGGARNDGTQIGLSKNVKTQPITAGSEEPTSLSATGDSAGAYSGGGKGQGSGSGSSGSGLGGLFGNSDSGATRGPAEVAFGHRQGDFNPMGSADPSDYFTFIKIWDNLFKRVSLQYSNQATVWNKDEARQNLLGK